MTRSSLHTYRRRIAFAETDAAGAAHFTALLRIAEEAEHDFLEKAGLPVMGAETGWPRVAARADFKAPLRFGDLVEARLDIRAAGATSVTWAFELRRLPDETLAAEGEITACHVRRGTDGWKPCPLPETLAALARARLEQQRGDGETPAARGAAAQAASLSSAPGRTT